MRWLVQGGEGCSGQTVVSEIHSSVNGTGVGLRTAPNPACDSTEPSEKTDGFADDGTLTGQAYALSAVPGGAGGIAGGAASGTCQIDSAGGQVGCAARVTSSAYYDYDGSNTLQYGGTATTCVFASSTYAVLVPEGTENSIRVVIEGAAAFLSHASRDVYNCGADYDTVDAEGVFPIQINADLSVLGTYTGTSEYFLSTVHASARVNLDGSFVMTG